MVQALIIVAALLFLSRTTAVAAASCPAPDSAESRFVDIKSVVPGIRLDIRYAGPFNFVGDSINGYQSAKCLLSEPAAAALASVQSELKNSGHAVKIFDCYRPQRAVDHFVSWAENLSDKRMKAVFYPGVEKADLFEDGYIATRSGHSRGSTVDLTLIHLEGKNANSELDMGSPFDFFDPVSNTANGAISALARENRQLLVTAMAKGGFKNLPEEWWHYTLIDEPYPDCYFNFVIR